MSRGINQRKRAEPAGIVEKAKGHMLVCCLFAIGLLQEACLLAEDSAGGGWFFEQPALKDLHNSSKKVFAHYFSQFPVSIDNLPTESDYYTLEYLSPNGEAGKHSSYGGYLRDRPLPRRPRLETNWKLQDKIEEVRLARAAGLDGFTFDILATTGPHWESLLTLLEAAKRTDPEFRIVLMPDMLAEFKDHSERLVSAVQSIANDPSIYRLPDGRIVLAPYGASKQPPAWWKEQLALLAREKIAIALVPVFQGWEKFAPAYEDITYGMSDWGASNVEELEKRENSSERAHALGQIWMAPVRPQDFRPKDRVFFEAHNTELFRHSWESAIVEQADWVQVITWNDYSENSQIEPSAGIGSSFYDLTAYYATWFKSNRPPKILRDVLFYTYRPEPVETPSSNQELSMTTSAHRVYNDIELLGMLQSPGTLEISIAGMTYRKDVGSGPQYLRVPVAVGRPQFYLYRSDRMILSGVGKRDITSATGQNNLQYISGRID